MKTFVMMGCAGLALAGSLLATPDHSVSVVERFFGSNETGYALIRTENDNQCSYYVSREKTWLDEYSKDDTERKAPRSTLLLDVTVTRDATHNDPDTPVPVSRNVNEQDGTLSMALLMERYPMQESKPWTAEELEKMEAIPDNGIRFRSRQFIADSRFIMTKVFTGRHDGDAWRLDGVGWDGNCLYLQLAIGQDTDPETRIMCISPEISKRVMDQMGMQPLYLVEGTYDSKEAAIERAKALRELAREKKYYGFHPEVWEMNAPTGKTVYLLVESDSKAAIAGGKVSITEINLGIDFTPMSSERFARKVPLGGGF